MIKIKRNTMYIIEIDDATATALVDHLQRTMTAADGKSIMGVAVTSLYWGLRDQLGSTPNDTRSL